MLAASVQLLRLHTTTEIEMKRANRKQGILRMTLGLS